MTEALPLSARAARLLVALLLAAGGCGPGEDRPQRDPPSVPADAGAGQARVEPPVDPAASVPEPVAPPTVPRGPAPPRGRFVQSDAEPYDFVVEPEEIDLGVLRPDEDARCSFEIVNRDARPLRLVNVDGSCDCVGFEYPRGDVPPGARRRVDVAIRAENRGNKLLSAFVQANDRTVTTRTLSIRYVIEPEFEFDPPRADFGSRVRGAATRLELALRYRLPVGLAPLELAPKLVCDAPVVVTLGAPVTAPLVGDIAQIVQPLTLELDTTGELVPFRGELRFEEAGHRPAKLPISGSVHGDVWLDPAELQLGVVEVGRARRGSVRLRWVSEPAKIDSIRCSGPELSAEALPDAGAKSLRVQVELVATAAGDYAGEITITTPQTPEPLLLRVRAKVR